MKPQRRAWWSPNERRTADSVVPWGMGLCWKGDDVKNTGDPPVNAHIPSPSPNPSSGDPHPLNKLTHMLKDGCSTNGSKGWARAMYEKCIVQPGGHHPPPSPLRAHNQGGPVSGAEGFRHGMEWPWLRRRQSLSHLDVIYWPTLNLLLPPALPVTPIDLVQICPHGHLCRLFSSSASFPLPPLTYSV